MFQRLPSLPCVCSPSGSLGQRGTGALQSRERLERPWAGTGSRGRAGLGWVPSALLRGLSADADGSPASPAPPSQHQGLHRWVRSSSLSNSSNCPVQEREGGRLLLSARLSQSEIPAEQLKIAGQLVVRPELARERGICLPGMLPGHGAGEIRTGSVPVWDRLQWDGEQPGLSAGLVCSRPVARARQG